MNVAQLWEEANKALDHLLVTRYSLDARKKRQVSNFGMALHQIESDTTEAIKEVKALCACTTWDMETHLMALTSEAKVSHATCLKGIEDECSFALAEAENCCSTTIRQAESNSASRAHSTQQSHAKDIQHLEAEAIEEVGKDCLALLTACSATLRASPPEDCDIIVTPYHLLLGNAPTSTLLSIPPGYPLLNGNLPHRLLLSLPQQPLDPHPGPNSGTTCLTGWGPFPICGYLQSDPQGASPIQAEGGNASPHGPV